MYKKIDNLSKNNNYVYMFFQYGLENYSNRILLTNDKFFLISEDGIVTLIKNINVIKDLLLNTLTIFLTGADSGDKIAITLSAFIRFPKPILTNFIIITLYFEFVL